MTKLEEIARAMCESDGADWFAANSMKTANGEEPEEQRQYWREKAIAAVRALREPTDAMEMAGNDALVRNGCIPVDDSDAPECWQAMIDQILADTEEGR